MIDYVEKNFNFGQIWSFDYEEALNSGDPDFNWLMPSDEWDAITVNYTSGTTGDQGCCLSSSRSIFTGTRKYNYSFNK
ncbi:MAG: hypothetical protein CM15mP117_00670 [Alphaproteobacteria bacterium]|nr:MAG: hypothetical protein CM15mP117_00670 [Alphaproteobacteria bacterium]